MDVTTASSVEHTCSLLTPNLMPTAGGQAYQNSDDSRVTFIEDRSHGMIRGSLLNLWRPPRPRLSRWAGTHRRSLLHEFSLTKVRPDRRVEMPAIVNWQTKDRYSALTSAFSWR